MDAPSPIRVRAAQTAARARWADHDTRTLRMPDLSPDMAAAIRALIRAAREGDAALAARQA